MSEQIYSDMMHFSGSQSEGNQKMTERRLIAHKNTPREKPQGVFGVQYYLFAAVFVTARHARRTRRSPCDRRGVRSRNWYGVRRSLASATVRARRGRSRPAVRGALVDTSVYLKPAKLFNVALDVLARLAPCLNLGVGELRHKDLLDTIGAYNCRK